MKSISSLHIAGRFIAGLYLLLAILVNPAMADFQRTKIAVLDFAMIGEKLEPEGIGAILSEWFITSIVKSGRFDVVERAMLQKIIAEQNLSTSGLVDESTASELGKLLGVDVIITGSILNLRNTIDINARIISVQSGSIIAAESIGTDTDRDYHELVKQLTIKIMQNFPLTGYIVKKDKKTATIDLGSISGLSSGIEFLVYREGEVIKHPKTGEVLDVEQIPTGHIRITKVSRNVSVGDILAEEGEGIEYGHLVKSIQGSDSGSAKSDKPRRNVPAGQAAAVPVPAVAKQAAPPQQAEKEQAKKTDTPEGSAPAIVRAEEDSPPAPAVAAQSAPPAEVRKGKTKKRTGVKPPQADTQTAQQASAPVPAQAAPVVFEAPSATEPAPAAEKAVAAGGNKPAEGPPSAQPGTKRHIAVFPSVFNMKADVIENMTNGRVPDVVREVLEEIDRSRQFKLTNHLKDKSLRKVAWSQYKPNANGIFEKARQEGIDFVILYYFSFWEGQGLVNGWGTDFQNPEFKVYLVDVQNQKILKEEDSRTTALDQLFLELKGMTRKLFRKTDFHD